MPCRFVGMFVNGMICHADIDWDIVLQPGEERRGYVWDLVQNMLLLFEYM